LGTFGEAKVKYLDGGARPAKLHFPLISKGKTVMETAHADTKPVFTVMVKMTGMGRIEKSAPLRTAPAPPPRE
jgi:hypothetical protein